ncbi:putative bifunctional diguanylate cyclase/phosphodiesterase [Rubrobacter tropicus]|uniref:putative bifunctional diguanylate cyclase/phosphodiesterase n=1 Tax=Rubrobacter tropicus TaxID=2653851 RepID=UPI001407AB70|nr:EAL domain-containing protein [Rubrobacter tropicus]
MTHPEDLEKSRARMERLFEEGGSKYTLEKRYVRSDGRVVWAMLNVSLVRDADGNPHHFVSQFQEVTERRALEDRLRHQALHDPLTGLPNRGLFVDRLGHALGKTRRQKGLKVAVLFMDLDNFKGVNDSLGHDAGDLLLTVVAQRLGRSLRPEDTLARFGGDEFVVLLQDVEAADEAVRVAERIADGFRSPFRLDGRELYARVSTGIAMGDARTKTPEDLLRDADTAMYRAKEAGGGYEMFDPAMHQRALGRLELENDLRRAVEEDEFAVHYQPIVNLQTGELWGMEALVRWDHPERGLLDPDEFVPVAEESGLVVPMGELVLEEACRRAVVWQRELPRTPPLAVSVNLSGRQLRRPDLQDVIRRALEESGLSASSLGLDITETVYIGAMDANTAALDRIKALGVRVSLDDFGSGYSSLSYLKRLPADILKVDKSFTKGLGLEAEDTAIVQTVVDLAHILGMEVVAEGVEVDVQETLLREMGCDFGQGYHFSRPLPPEGALEFLNSAYRGVAHRGNLDGLSDSS